MFKVTRCCCYYNNNAVSRRTGAAVSVSSRNNGCGLQPGRDSACLYITDSWDLMHMHNIA